MMPDEFLMRSLIQAAWQASILADCYHARRLALAASVVPIWSTVSLLRSRCARYALER